MPRCLCSGTRPQEYWGIREVYFTLAAFFRIVPMRAQPLI